MADAPGAQNVRGVEHGVRSADFTGVNEPLQAARSGVIIYLAEFRRRAGEFVAAHSERDHAGAAQPHGALADLARRVGPKLAYRVEDPPQTQTTRFVGLDGFADSAKIRFDVLFAQKHDAH